MEEANAGAMMVRMMDLISLSCILMMSSMIMIDDVGLQVNAINTELVCGEAGRRPLKILFPPSANQVLPYHCQSIMHRGVIWRLIWGSNEGFSRSLGGYLGGIGG